VRRSVAFGFEVSQNRFRAHSPYKVLPATLDWTGRAVIVLFMKRVVISMAEFETFAKPLVGLPVSHIWNGYGSAIFFEFGLLNPSVRRRRDGSLGNPSGEFTLMIEWSWRIEGKRRIWCGSWSDEERWTRMFLRLQGARVAAISATGRIPEVDLALNNGLHVVSCMTAEGDPEWGLLKRNGEETTSVGVSAGRLVLTADLPMRARQ
jgi:hypothetical protein